MKLIIYLIAFLLYSISGFSKNYTISDPIDLPQVGINKVLQVSNGNTLLFHLQNNKAIQVFVFDNDGKQIASSRFVGKTINVSTLEKSTLKGIYEINNEAILFLSQELFSKESLIKIHFNTTTGKAVKEDILIESPNITNTYNYHIAFNPNSKGYAVFPMKDLEANFKEKLYLHIYNEEHQLVNKLLVNINASDYDYVKFSGINKEADGSVGLILIGEKIVQYPDILNRETIVSHFTNDAQNLNTVITKLPADALPYYSFYTYNEFEKEINVFIVNGIRHIIKHGLEKRHKDIYTPMMLRYNAYDISDMTYSYIYYEKANKMLYDTLENWSERDTPAPTHIFTNKYGLTILLSEEILENVIINGKSNGLNKVGDIYVTMINSSGKEIWATVLPKTQYIQSKILPHTIKNRGTSQDLFRHYDPRGDYYYQFLSYNTFTTAQRNTFIIHNDLKKNFDKTIDDYINYVVDEGKGNHLLNTDAICYKIKRDKTVEKEYLFEEQPANKSIAAMVEGAHYNEHTNTYATPVQYREDNDYSIRLAWVKFDE